MLDTLTYLSNTHNNQEYILPRYMGKNVHKVDLLNQSCIYVLLVNFLGHDVSFFKPNLHWNCEIKTVILRYLAQCLTHSVSRLVRFYFSAMSHYVICHLKVHLDQFWYLHCTAGKILPHFYVRPASLRWKFTILESKILSTLSCCPLFHPFSDSFAFRLPFG